VSNELIDRLKDLGFKEYESKVFSVLLNGSLMSASEIAKKANIIRNSIYDILKSFVDKGYCNEIETNSVLQYQIIDPAIIFDKIERSINESHKRNLELLKSTRANAQPIYDSKDKDEDKSINVELIRGIHAHRVAKYISLLKETQSKLYGMYRLKGLVSEELDEIAGSLIKKGGEVRSIYHVGLDFKVQKEGKAQTATHKDLIRVMEAFEKNGEQVRLSEKDIPNMTIFDDKKVFFNLGDKSIPSNKRADLIVKYDDFAGYMKDLFDYYWTNSMTLEEYKKKHT
jgi:HTH-type transcriptional regulator, sugar sensing transcriptional regulator